jgi:hypothetical protein
MGMHVYDPGCELAAMRFEYHGIFGKSGEGDVGADFLDEAAVREEVRRNPSISLSESRIFFRCSGCGLARPNRCIADEERFGAVKPALVDVTCRSSFDGGHAAKSCTCGVVIAKFLDRECCCWLCCVIRDPVCREGVVGEESDSEEAECSALLAAIFPGPDGVCVCGQALEFLLHIYVLERREIRCWRWR